LGGSLIQQTTIDQNNFNLVFDLNGASNFSVQNTNTPTLTVTPAASVGINTPVTDPTALVEMSSTSRGLLLSRMTRAERDLIPSPAFGLVIYNITDSVAQHWNGVCWLSMWQKDCNDCDFDISIADSVGIIDKIFTDSITTTISITQTTGALTNIGLFLTHNLPPGATAILDNYVLNGSGISTLTVTADIFTPAGSYPILVQAACGNLVQSAIFVVQIDSCIEITVSSNFTDYDLQLLNALPGPGTPICVIVNVLPAAELQGNGGSAFTSGNLDAQSHVGIKNNGRIFGKGGDGGIGGNFATFGDPGLPGTNAITLTTKTTLQNNGYIFGGGGGGGSVGLGFSIPIVGAVGLGAGGGGGAPNGLGGNVSVGLLYAPGQNATGGISGNGGLGGSLNVPVSLPLGPVDVALTPSGFGGSGGAYGSMGASGNLFVNVQVSVPFVGTIFNQNFPNPPVSSFPPGGTAGMAVKRNGFPLIGLPDGTYFTSDIKGVVGP
jgi:hypothetical protein